jgi:prepilin peptidase CpaA
MTTLLALPWPLVFFAVLLGAALVTDFLWLRIPNWIALSLTALFAFAAVIPPHNGAWWLSHIAGGVIVLAVGFALFAWGKIGGGDAKLMAAIGLWAGLTLLPSLLLTIGIMNGAVILAFMAARPLSIGHYLERRGFRAVSLQPGKDMPFAIAAAGGCWIFLGEFLR